MSDAVFFSNSNFLAPKLLLLLLVNKYTGMNIYTYTSVVMFHMIIEFDPIHSRLQMKILFGYQRLHDFWTLKAEIEVVLKLFSSFYSGALLKKLPQFEEILSKCFYFGLFMQLKSTLLFIYLPRSKMFSSCIFATNHPCPDGQVSMAGCLENRALCAKAYSSASSPSSLILSIVPVIMTWAHLWKLWHIVWKLGSS